MNRCGWAKESDKLMCEYHDREYGRIKKGDAELFEKLCLECFQAGLSWRTVLCKREDFRRCFFGFDIRKVAVMTHDDTQKLMRDASIIRNRRKIEGVINNAKRHLDVFGEEGSFSRYVYAHDDAQALSKGLKSLGYRFVGPTICESFLMSVGAVEAHEESCFLYGKL